MTTKTDDEYEKFLLVAKRILKKDLSTNQETLKGYRDLILKAYNRFAEFVQRNFYVLSRPDQAKLENRLEQVRGKFTECLERLKCSYNLPNDLHELINEQDVGQIDSRVEVNVENLDTPSTASGLNAVSVTVHPPTPTLTDEEISQEVLEFERQRVERERIEAQKVENERLEAERQRLEATERRRVELERIEREKAELERNERERAELVRIEQERAELERIERERAEAEERERESVIAEQERQRRNMTGDALKTTKDLLDIVNGQIRKPYNGEPLGLQTFLTGVEIALTFA